MSDHLQESSGNLPTASPSQEDLEATGTPVLRKNLQALIDGWRIVVNQGGTGSSKTYSLCQAILGIALFDGFSGVISVVRQTMPSLRATAMRDFQDVIERYGVYDPRNHDKTNSIYRIGRTEVEFFGLDESQKVRGRKREILWCNEANELSYEEFQQLIFRTSGTIFLDYNPSDVDHWIYDRVLTRDDATLIVSTYRDNPFLEKHKVAEIERLEKEDASMWRVYGLGERGIRRTAIFSRFDLVDNFPSVDETIWGLDFGFNNPTGLIRVGLKDGQLYLDEWLYRSHLTNAELIEKMIEMNVPKNEQIFADAAEPNRIEEISRYGFLAYPADKGKDSVRKGIDTLKARMVHITKRSTNLLRDWKSYSWKMDKDSNILDEPVKFNDHACDAVRYAVYTHLQNNVTVEIF